MCLRLCLVYLYTCMFMCIVPVSHFHPPLPPTDVPRVSALPAFVHVRAPHLRQNTARAPGRGDHVSSVCVCVYIYIYLDINMSFLFIFWIDTLCIWVLFIGMAGLRAYIMNALLWSKKNMKINTATVLNISIYNRLDLRNFLLLCIIPHTHIPSYPPRMISLRTQNTSSTELVQRWT